VVEIKARQDQPVHELKLPKPAGPWAAEEVWVFEAKNHLRLVWVKGLPAIDPQQTTLPAAWKSLGSPCRPTASDLARRSSSRYGAGATAIPRRTG
jgi:hypothetical protein